MTTKPSSLLDAIKIPPSPFPGLRPFEPEESDLFFGRDEQIEKLMDKLANNRFLAVVGTSGSGKSSLVRAGLAHALRSGMMTEAGTKWRIAVMRPSNDPIGYLARALNAPEVFGSDDTANVAIQIAVAEATLRLGSRGLIETVRQNVMPETENLLVVVDQFEELFRFAREARKAKNERFDNDAAAFVKLLLEAVKRNERGEYDANIYVLLTMRSDFLGDCSQFWDLPEAINESQYLIPRLTRDQLREVIEGPVAVGVGQIAQRLVNQLLNDITDNQDQLPILQHALMRTWDEWKHPRHEHQPSRGVIDICCYESTGGMKEALSRHADEAYSELDELQRKVAEKVFKCLTEKGEDNREIRRPVTLGELIAVAQAGDDVVETVIDTFRRPGRSFLMPPAETPLHSDTLIDISHESLIRVWKRLQQWVSEEAESAAIYRRLIETALLQKAGRSELWRGVDLQVGLEWQERNRPNEAWAKRYRSGFETGIAFLLASERKREEERAETEQRQTREAERAKRELAHAQALAEAQTQAARVEKQRADQQARATVRLRRLLTALILIALLAGIAAAKAWQLYQRAEAETLRAQKAETEANREKAIADDERDRAKKDREEAETQKAIAEAQTIEAKKQRQSAVRSQRQAEESERDAQKQRQLALARQLATSSEANLAETTDVPVTGFLLSLESLRAAWTVEGYKNWARSAGLFLRHPGENWQWKKHQGAVMAMASSRDGRLLASLGHDGTFGVWDAQSGKEVFRQATQVDPNYNAIAISPDSRWLATSHGRGVRVWQISNDSNWQVAKELNAPGDPIFDIEFSPDSSFVAIANHSPKLQVYRTSTWDEISFPEAKPGKYGIPDEIRATTFSPDSHYLLTAGRESVIVWKMSPTNSPKLIQQVDQQGWNMAMSPDGKRLAIRNEGGLELWDVDWSNNITPLKRYSNVKVDVGNNMLTMGYSPDGQYLFAADRGGNGIGRIWRVSEGAKATEVARTAYGTRAMVFSPDGRWLFAGGATGEITKWVAKNDLASGRLPHKRGVNSIAFSHDGKLLATASDDRMVRIFDVSKWSEITRLEHEAEVQKVYFIPVGGRLITATATAIRVFKVGENWRQLAHIEPKEPIFTKVTVSPDGKYLSTWSRLEPSDSEKTLIENQTVWETDNGRPIASARQEYEPGTRRRSKKLLQDTATGLTKDAGGWREIRLSESDNNPISPGGQLRAGINYTSVQLSETIDQTPVTTMEHENRVTDLAFSPDGRWLVTASKDGMVGLWSFWPEDLIRDACARLPRNLSVTEWKKYIGDIPYSETCPGLPGPKK